MASAMRKMAVYLGLVEDDHRYDDHYPDEYGEGDEYGDYVTEFTRMPGARAERPPSSTPTTGRSQAEHPCRRRGAHDRPGKDHYLASAHLQ